MIIAVQRGMDIIKNELELRGHKVVFSDEYNHPIDVAIYSKKSEAFVDCCGSSNLLHCNSTKGGVIQIDPEGKSIRDIEAMIFIKRRRNSTSFF